MAYSPERATSGFGQSYFQLFRDGKVECVDSQLLRTKEGRGRVMPSIAVGGVCIASLSRIFKLFRVLDVEAPAAVMLTFLGVESYTMALDPMLGYGSSEIDRDALIIAGEIAESYDPSTSAAVMRPIFDVERNGIIAMRRLRRERPAFTRPNELHPAHGLSSQTRLLIRPGELRRLIPRAHTP
jgi:hypothetical protein